MLELSKKTVIASVLFVDIVGYSKRPVGLQLEIKDHLSAAIGSATARVAAEERIMLDTGDGAALCFLTSPEEALEAALAIRNSLDGPDSHPPGGYQLCMGINLGPVRLIKDINGQRNIVGDGINAAQRVMSFAAPNQILVSRAFHDIVAFLVAQQRTCFRYHGTHADKHGREHEVYQVTEHGELDPGEDATGQPPQPFPSHPAQTRPDPLLASAGPAVRDFALPEAMLHQVEQRYARYVGPIAHVLVKRILAQAHSASQVCERLKDLISDDQQKIEFEHFFCNQILGEAGGATTQDAPLHQAETTPDMSSTTNQTTSAGSVQGCSEQQLEQLGQQLARVLGPIARMLVQRESRQASGYSDLCRRLAGHIEQPEERERFLRQAEGG